MLLGSRKTMPPGMPVPEQNMALPDFSGAGLPTGAQMPQAPGVQQAATPDLYAGGIKGVGQRIGDALHRPGMSSALFRAAGAAFNGDGLGGMISAGAGEMDRQHEEQQHTQQQQFENQLAALKQRTDAAHKAAMENRVHYQAVPEGGTLVGMRENGSFVDPVAASRFVAGGTQPAAPAAPAGPAVGTVQRGYRFRGGDPASPDAWEQVGGAPSQGGATFR